MYDNNPNVTEKGYMYGKWMTWDNTWFIEFGTQCVYLLVGEEKALLIDSGYGNGDLRKFVEEITDKPVMVVNTHGHFDHTGGNAFWEEVYLSEPSSKDAKQAFGEEMQKAFEAMPHPDYKMNIVGDGYVFDLGGRKVEVITIGCHHPGSIALLDHGARLLFTGDELEAGQVLLFDDIEKQAPLHKANMEKLLAREAEYDFVCPAHNGTPLNKKYVHDYLMLDTQLIEGTAKVMPNTAGYGYPPVAKGMGGEDMKSERVQYGGASFCYRKK